MRSAAASGDPCAARGIPAGDGDFADLVRKIREHSGAPELATQRKFDRVAAHLATQ
jgi:hypothetical protein